MGGIGIRLDEETVLPGLAAMARNLEDATPLWDDVGRFLVLRFQEHFEAQRDPEGNPWKPSRRALAQGGATLRDTGRLYASLTHNAWKSGVEAGTNVEYAIAHQTGMTIRAKTAKGLFIRFRPAGANKDEIRRPQQVTLPRRAFIGINDDDADEIMAIAARYAEGLFHAQ